MKYQEPLKQILNEIRELWDGPETRPAVRDSYEQVTRCRTMALGAELYASDTEEKVFPHPCKCRACPSCGHRATILWQREQWAALPNVRYVGINFTMPNVLWPIFRRNRHLLHDLPALAGSVIQQYLKVKHRVRGLVMVVPHTFGRKLNFHPPLHTLVSSGGLREGDNCWVNVDEFNKKALMEMWSRPRCFSRSSATGSSDKSSRNNMSDLGGSFTSLASPRRTIFIYYAGRYIRRPPIAQHRFTKIEDGEVCFMRKDTKLKKWLVTRYSIEDFVLTLADHIPDRYRHAIRYFGLLAPGAKGRTDRGVFAVLRQKKRPRPVRLRWAASIKRDFARDPLVLMFVSQSGRSVIFSQKELTTCAKGSRSYAGCSIFLDLLLAQEALDEFHQLLLQTGGCRASCSSSRSNDCNVLSFSSEHSNSSSVTLGWSVLGSRALKRAQLKRQRIRQLLKGQGNKALGPGPRPDWSMNHYGRRPRLLLVTSLSRVKKRYSGLGEALRESVVTLVVVPRGEPSAFVGPSCREASVAQTLYRETEPSRDQRQKLAQERRADLLDPDQWSASAVFAPALLRWW